MKWHEALGVAASALSFFIFLNSTETLDQLLARWRGVVPRSSEVARVFDPTAAVVAAALLLVMLALVFFAGCYRMFVVLRRRKVAQDADLAQGFFLFTFTLLGSLGALFLLATGPVGQMISDEFNGFSVLMWILLCGLLTMLSYFTVGAAMTAADQQHGVT